MVFKRIKRVIKRIIRKPKPKPTPKPTVKDWDVAVGPVAREIAKQPAAPITKERIATIQRRYGGGGAAPTPAAPPVGPTVAPEPELVKAAEVKKEFEKIEEEKERRRVEGRLPTERELRETLTVKPVARPEGLLERGMARIRRERHITKAERLRGEPSGLGLGGLTGQFALTGLGAAQFTKALITSPVKTAKAVPSGLIATGKFVTRGGLTRMIIEEPEAVTGAVIGEIALAKGLGVAARGVGRGAEIIGTRISPKFRPVTVVGKARVIKGIPSGLKPTKIKLAKPISKITEPLAKQVKLAGKEVTAVTAARDVFGKVLRKKVKIKKPLPTPKAPKLERALFADPRGRLRISRLGLEPQKKAKLLDVLAGDVTFKKVRPQALLFEKVKVAKFPKALKGIERKLKAGKILTPAEELKLTSFQLKPTGEFKPIGFLTKEPEIVLAPGEIIRKKGVPAVTLIKRKRVPIISTEIITPTKATRQLLEARKLTPKQLSTLTKRLTKETGFKVSRIIETRPLVSPVGLGASLVSPIARARPRARKLISPVLFPSRQIPKARKIALERLPKRPTRKPSTDIINQLLPTIPRALRKVPTLAPSPILPTPRPPSKRAMPLLIKDLFEKRLKVPKRFKKIRQPTAYQPSLTAAILGIKVPKKPKPIFGKLELGFLPGIRPMVRK